MLGAINTTLETNKPFYTVGETPTYIIRAAIPGSKVYWTSFKNNEATGEYMADYGHVVGANGTVELVAGGPWTSAEVGTWQKQALVIDPNNNQTLVQAMFRVSEAAPAATTTPPPSSQSGNEILDALNAPLFQLGNFDVTPLRAIGAALLWVYVIQPTFSKRR